MTAIIISSIIIMLASLVGVIFSWHFLGTFIKKHLGLFVSFSAGVFLILVINLSLEVFNHTSDFFGPVMWILAGMIGVLLLFRLLPTFHHHHSDEHEERPHSKLDVRKIIISDGIHNIGDGILLAASFSVSIPVGIAATIGIFIHELIQEISEFFVMRQAGLSVPRALLINFATSATILIGALGGFFLIGIFENIELPLLALSAGAFLIVVLQDLIPESIRHSRVEKNYLHHILFFVIGIILMFSVGRLFGHEHGHSHAGHDHSSEFENVLHTHEGEHEGHHDHAENEHSSELDHKEDQHHDEHDHDNHHIH